MGKKFFLLVVFMAAATLAAYAQTTITGRVLDAATGEGEPYVTYSIYAGDTKPLKMTITDENGFFTETIANNGEYTITFSTLGKKDLELPFTAAGEPIDFGELTMEDDEQLLKEASVTALRPLVKMEVDKMTYNIEDDVDSKSMTMLDMLRKVPMVTVDAQDNITVNGSSSFKVYVDGKPNQMLSSNPSKIFKMMPASTFKSAEVITNPGAKYDAEGVGGVLNLITDKSLGQKAIADGYNGSVELEADSKGSLGAGVFFTGQKGKFSVSGNVNLFREKVNGLWIDYDLQNLDASGNVASDLTYSGTLNETNPGIFSDLSASYEIDTLRLLTATLDLTSFAASEIENFVCTMTTPSAGQVFSYNADIDVDYRRTALRTGLDYQRSFANVEGRTLTASYLLSSTPTINDNYSYYNGHDTDRHSDNEERMLEQTAQLDYTTPWGKDGSFSTGAKFISRANTSDSYYYALQGGDWTLDNANTVQFRHLSSILGAYGEYTLSKEKWGAKAGLRYEHTFQQVKYLTGNGSDFDLDYGNLVPSASVQYNFSELSNIGLSYNLRISRPGISYLNPYVDRINPYSISYGNVDLKTEKAHNIGLVWNYYSPVVMVNLTGRYSFCNNNINQYSFFDSDGVLNSTYGNIARRQDTGLSAFVNLNLGQKTRLYSNLGCDYIMLDSKAKGLSNSGVEFSAMSGLQHTLPWDLRASLNYMHRSRNLQLDGHTTGFSAVMASLTKTFLDDKISVTLNAVTGFEKCGALKIGMYQKGSDYISSTSSKYPLARAGITLSYNFGTSKNISVKKAKRSIENDDVLQKSSGNAASSATSATGM
ncbi:MAG: TonB-dependent receptor family protein [Bacteroidales bacterium]|nr:TonB-dependent receptor family protein [Bacteroidales bacterium]